MTTLGVCTNSFADVSASMFTDNMVLQRSMAVPVWGKAAPGETVAVSFAGQRKTTKAGPDGRWLVKLDPMEASFEPRTMTVSSGKTTIKFANVLVGEVWVASGQSNMEWPLKKSSEAQTEIPKANRSSIRLLSVPKSICESESGDLCGTHWTECTLETARSFSAVAYFFGCELGDKLNVPVGLIDSSVGASRAECWLSGQAIEKNLPCLEKELAALRKLLAEPLPQSAAGAAGVTPRRAYSTELCFNLGWAGVENPNSGDWKPVELPGYWQKRGYHFNGVMWFRKEIDLPAEWEGRALSISLGAIDKEDNTYFNGVKIGSIKFTADNSDAYAQKRVYEIPAGLAKKGRNVIATQARSEYFDAGLYGPAELMSLRCPSLPESQPLRLDGTWICAVESATHGGLFNPSFLFNGMIAPLAPYALRGAIWYQGESNADAASSHYYDILSTLVADWRAHWKRDDLAFYVVQLPGCGEKAPKADSPWAIVREAEAKVGQLPGCGMICALDLGDGGLHPSSKMPVGKRLAAEALSKTYGVRDAVARGPVFKSAADEGEFIRISFAGANGGLKTKDGDPVRGFAVSGSDGAPHEAKAVVDGNDILVSTEGISSPSEVFYAWADNPDCNLSDGAGLPAEPFRANPHSEAASPASAAGIAAIKALKIDRGAITKVERDASPTATFCGHLNNHVPPRTVVRIVLNPAKGSNINVEITLPDPGDWSGRLLGTGNGGPAGGITDGLWMMTFGWAVVTTDMGTAPNPHIGVESPEQAGIGNQEVWKDFGFRATHLMTVVAKQVIKAYYGREPDHSYFFGGSTGGQQGYQEAQRYPDDYDGIIANVPAHCRVPLHAYFLWNDQILRKCPFTQSQQDNVIAAGKDYMASRELTPMTAGKMVSDPRHDSKDIDGVIALAMQKDSTLTKEHAEALRKLFDGPRHAVTGERIFGGIPFGASFDIARGYLYLFHWVFGAGKTLDEMNFGEDIDRYIAALGPYLNAENPDLSPFEKHGGKMITLVGTADSCVPFHSTFDYYERVVESLGGIEKVRQFYRLYVVPGMSHGVPFGIPEMLDHIVKWREKGIAPDVIHGLCVANGKTSMDMPLYPYPAKTGWDAASDSFKPVDGPRGGVERVAARFRPPAVE